VLTPSIPTVLAAAAVACGSPIQDSVPSLVDAYRAGTTFPEFLAAARRRVALWQRTAARASVPDALGTRVAEVPGEWHLLVIAEDGCSDSANSVPYLAKLAEVAPNLDLRIIDSRRGRPFMKRHRTPDGRAATPTVLLLDDRFQLAGCWIERPAELQAWHARSRAQLSDQEYLRLKFAWYDRDAGRSTLEEITQMIEAAGQGTPSCGEALFDR
jgi:hypothetical protein